MPYKYSQKMVDYVKKFVRLMPESVYTKLKYIYKSIQRRNNAYYCRALTGESNYNICINSDMSVSCNCSDYDGSGHIGDLSRQGFQEIFDGEVATRFRSELASGKLPISQCINCPELEIVSKKNAIRKAHEYSLPKKGIMVENTVGCNLECLACDRKVVDTRKKRMMSLEDIRLVALTVQMHSIEQVCYHNLGEPFLSKRILDEMRIFREHNPDTMLFSSTNGVFLDSQTKRQAALYFDHLFFSIDGATQTSLEQYQVGGDFHESYVNMAEMVTFRDAQNLTKPIIEWKYVVFEWNDSQEEIEEALRMAREANVDIISFWPGGMPVGMAGISNRFKTDAFFSTLGEKSWKGREVVLRPDHAYQRQGSA